MSVTTVMKILRKTQFPPAMLTEIGEKTKDPFKVLISCILSLRTMDAVTAAASERLYKMVETPEEMIKLSLRDIKKAIYPVGFYKTKARYIQGICKKLIKEYNGKVPDSIEELLSFKGVGRKTANIVLVYGFGKPGIAVDVHVHVIANRLGWVNTKTPDQTEMKLRETLPKIYWMDINDLFVKHGQNICLTRKPKCSICPIKKYCKYYREIVASHASNTECSRPG